MKQRLVLILSCILLAIKGLAESTETISVTFANYPQGTSYAVNEKHDQRYKH